MSIIRFIALVIAGCISLSLAGQKDSPYITASNGMDVGINVTSVVTSFTGNETQIQAEDLPIFVRWTRPNSAFRIGLGAKATKREFFDNITFANRDSKDQAYHMKLGLEMHTALDARWQFYYGVDAVGKYLESQVQIFGGTGLSTIKQNVLGLGASTFVGIRYFVGKRFYLSTEANLMFLSNTTSTTEESNNSPFPQPPPPPTSRETNGSEFILSAPIMLYANYRIK